MAQNLISLGIVIIFIGLIITMIGALSQKSDTKVAVGGFVGFIPFGFANDKNLLYILAGLMFILALFFFILPYLRN